MAEHFHEVVEKYHLAARELIKGNPEAYKKLFSQREDVTLANPFGPVKRGWKQVAAAMDHAAGLFSDGEFVSFDSVSRYETADLAFLVEVERFKVKIGARRDLAPVALRTTSILRPEEGTWKIVHRQADPITSDQSPESIIQK